MRILPCASERFTEVWTKLKKFYIEMIKDIIFLAILCKGSNSQKKTFHITILQKAFLML